MFEKKKEMVKTSKQETASCDLLSTLDVLITHPAWHELNVEVLWPQQSLGINLGVFFVFQKLWWWYPLNHLPSNLKAWLAENAPFFKRKILLSTCIALIFLSKLWSVQIVDAPVISTFVTTYICIYIYTQLPVYIGVVARQPVVRRKVTEGFPPSSCTCTGL